MKNKVIQISIVLVAAFLILILFHFKTRFVMNEIEKHNEQIERTILKTVKDNFKIDNISVLSIELDSIDTTKKETKLSNENIQAIEKHIAVELSKYYKNQDSTSYNQSIPFIVLPELKDKQGNIILRPIDLENIQKHIKFLSEKTDLAVRDVKDELGRDIDRLNLWTSIWMAILAIFGAFLPIYIGLSTQSQTDKRFIEIKGDLEGKSNTLTQKIDDDISKAKTEFSEIKLNADSALQAAKNAEDKSLMVQEDISKHEKSFDLIKSDVSSIKSEIIEQNKELAMIKIASYEASESTKQVELKLIKAISDSEIALEKSDKAEKLLYFSHALSNLKRMDLQNLPNSGVKLYEYLSRTFNSIKIQFETLHTIPIEDTLFRSFIKELMQNLNIIKRLIDNRDVLKEMDSLIVLLNSLFNSNNSDKNNILKDIIVLLNSLIENFKKLQIQ